MLTAHESLIRSEKILAWFAIANGVLTAANPILILAFGLGSPNLVGAIFCLVLGAFSTIAGIQCLTAKPWAYWLLFGTFAIQVAEYFSQSFSISLIEPLSFKFGFQWFEPPSRINFNVLALLVCFYSARAAQRLTSRSSGSPQAAPAEL